jgi:dTDP-4-dehydrorhamnose reductase
MNSSESNCSASLCVLITGGYGQLGTAFKKLFGEMGVDYILTDYDTLDITDANAVKKYVEDNDISVIINCAAYNEVDKAEIEREKCFLINAYAPENLAKVAKEYGIDFITYSTDFVFDGTKNAPYVEEDEANPLSVYGLSKREGELRVINTYDRVFLIRTSWVFGIGNKNFNTQVLGWSKNNSVLKIVDDQISAPTYAYDLAFFSWKLYKTRKYGLYHLSNGGVASKYDQARYLLSKIGWKGELLRAKSSEFNLPAKRPHYSKLDSSKLEGIVRETIPSWQSGIDRYLKDLEENDGI